jgi:hypothetical protein
MSIHCRNDLALGAPRKPSISRSDLALNKFEK